MEERYYQKEIETMPHEQIRAMQSEKLVKQVNAIRPYSDNYKELG